MDLFGNPAEYEMINSIAQEMECGFYQMLQSFGASLNGRKVGKPWLMPLLQVSFKPLGCCGDGGAIFTNDDQLAGKLTLFESMVKVLISTIM